MGHYHLDLISTKKIAILDVNNFYVSCERLFQPHFKKIPSVVLSNNDGCIIARSQESKDLGIKMGQPLFQLEEVTKSKLKKFSSNYALYDPSNSSHKSLACVMNLTKNNSNLVLKCIV
jgi:DNA polymerase V